MGRVKALLKWSALISAVVLSDDTLSIQIAKSYDDA
jgi:hypothetical protein